jgi:hypothetical protein
MTTDVLHAPMIEVDNFTDRYFWSRHANSGSVWTLFAAFPMLVLGIYRRDQPLLIGTLLFVLVNPLLFSPPTTDTAWATRVVLGEQIWPEQGLRSSPTNLVFITLAAPVYLYNLRAAAKRNSVRTLLSTALSMALMLLFFRQMSRLYEDRGSRNMRS